MLEARIVLVYKDDKEAKAVSQAVSPDNIKTPRNLLVETSSKGNCLVAEVKYEGLNLMTFLSTLDDLLSSISVAEKTLLAVKRLKKAAR